MLCGLHFSIVFNQGLRICSKKSIPFMPYIAYSILVRTNSVWASPGPPVMKSIRLSTMKV